MGRKPKNLETELELSPLTTEQPAEVAEAPVAQLTNTALSLVQKEGKWQLVKIMYDPRSGETGVASFTPQEDKMEAIYNFKLNAGKHILPD